MISIDHYAETFAEYAFFDCPNISDPDFALLNATVYGDYKSAQVLVHCNETDINTMWQGETPLYIAATRGYTGIVELLISNPRLNITVADYFERKVNSALEIASFHGHLDIVKMLLQLEEYDINEVSYDNHIGVTTALCSAAKEGHIEVVSLLLQVPGLQDKTYLTST